MLMYDGACGLCARSVRFVLAHERRPVLHFAPLDGAAADAIRQSHRWLEGVDSLVLVDHRGVSVRSTAALRLTHYLRWPWRPLMVGWLLPRAWRDRLYDLVAAHRHRVGGRACLVPLPDARHRFLN